ncbi:MAG: Lrp/AsnC family transcriptional regulator [Methanobacteriota archaeon]|nr:MAG: Lrp/AsnC family transcriptional regulator [Euryarchaeota archaeon]
MENLDELDTMIIQQLMQDSRIQYRKLVELTGKSLGTVSNRIQRLQDLGIIKHWTVLVDPEKIGFDLTVLINIQIDVKFLDTVNEHLSGIPELVAIYNITGEFDITAIARVRSRRHLDAVIHRILETDHIRRTSSNVVLRILKENFRLQMEEKQ